MNTEALTLRTDYLEKNKWVATTMGMGNKGEVEFIINPDLIEGGLFYIAAGLMPESNPQNIISLPKTARACADHGLVSGSPDRSYPFMPEEWHEVVSDK